MFFFFKQKTAYDMGISDWSSDVCSSDLVTAERVYLEQIARPGCAAGSQLRRRRHTVCKLQGLDWLPRRDSGVTAFGRGNSRRERPASGRWRTGCSPPTMRGDASENTSVSQARSEEHTSELQSLMRISYAVFCLKKKQKNNTSC